MLHATSTTNVNCIRLASDVLQRFEQGFMGHFRERFIAECEEFSSLFDLTGEGKRKRDAARRIKLEEVIKKSEKIKSGAVISLLNKKTPVLET